MPVTNRSAFTLLLLLPLALTANLLRAQEAGDGNGSTEEEDAKTIAELTEKSDKFDGLFTLYRDRENGTVHIAIEPEQLDKEYIYLAVTADGVVQANHFRGAYRDNRVISLQRHFNRIELRSENTAYYFDPESPLSRAAAANISPAVLAVASIVAEDEESGTMLIEADDLLLSESLYQVKPTPDPDRGPKEGFRLGDLNKNRSRIDRIQSYPLNTDVLVEYVYHNPAPVVRGGNDITDSRYVSIRILHSLIAMPENDYEPRLADFRLGHFAERVTDLTSASVTPYRDLIQRWHLVKRDPEAAISEPLEPIEWWIENTTPHEFRATIREAALRWNTAFEKIGFRNALVVRVQPDDADWDAGDIRYNVLRWTSSPNPPFGGYGPSFTNPRTGQILGADIMLEHASVTSRIRQQRVIDSLAGTPPGNDELSDFILCSLGHDLQVSHLFGRLAINALELNSELEEELMNDFLSMLTLHELGHTLGFTHNFAASQLLSLDEVFDSEAVEQTALTGSVMDYTDIHVPPDNRARPNFFQTKPGPYDDWIVEYSYSDSLDDPDAEHRRLAAIAARSTSPALAYGNDADDMRTPGKAVDPRINIYDMSSDSIGYAEARLALVNELLDNLKTQNMRPGESYQELVNAYLVLLTQVSNQVRTLTRFVGGIEVNRGLVDQEGAATPYVPVDAALQVRAMEILAEHLFSPDAFSGSSELYAHMQRQRRLFDFRNTTEDPKLHDWLLRTQKGALEHLLHPTVLERITDSRLYGNTYTVAEVMNDLTDAIFLEDLRGDVNTFRQNLQLEYVNRLTRMVDEETKGQYDYPSQSMALYQLREIRDLLDGKRGGNLETRAHTDHIVFAIDAALEAAAGG